MSAAVLIVCALLLVLVGSVALNETANLTEASYFWEETNNSDPFLYEQEGGYIPLGKPGGGGSGVRGTPCTFENKCGIIVVTSVLCSIFIGIPLIVGAVFLILYCCCGFWEKIDNRKKWGTTRDITITNTNMEIEMQREIVSIADKAMGCTSICSCRKSHNIDYIAEKIKEEMDLRYPTQIRNPPQTWNCKVWKWGTDAEIPDCPCHRHKEDYIYSNQFFDFYIENLRILIFTHRRKICIDYDATDRNLSEEKLKEAKRLANEALDSEMLLDDMAKKIKDGLDLSFFPEIWNCISGTDFRYVMFPCEEDFLSFKIEDLNVVIFKFKQKLRNVAILNKSTGINLEMQHEALSLAEKGMDSEFWESDSIAKKIKEGFNLKFPPEAWECIVANRKNQGKKMDEGRGYNIDESNNFSLMIDDDLTVFVFRVL